MPLAHLRTLPAMLQDEARECGWGNDGGKNLTAQYEHDIDMTQVEIADAIEARKRYDYMHATCTATPSTAVCAQHTTSRAFAVAVLHHPCVPICDLCLVRTQFVGPDRQCKCNGMADLGLQGTCSRRCS